MQDDKLLTRISGLLRQAEGTDNEHEAQAFMQAAQRLATAASIDLAVARAHAGGNRRVTPEQRNIAIGTAGKRGLRTYVQLFVAIARANDITCDVASNSTFVYAYGFPGDIDTCEALYSSLVVQMVAASDGYLKSGAYKGETFARVVTERRGWVSRRVVEEKPLSPITARLNFQSAFAERIGKRLAQARDEARAQAVADDGGKTDSGTALVLRNKEIEVRDFHQETSTARGTWQSQSASAGYSEGARRAGDRAGRRARLGDDAQLDGTRGALEA
ncbi:MAG: DUF2786 domain-containing protein [Gordonia sp.]|uniref:DUF2786 domain-containing protein n=1 Tax=Gordonia rubripertincta TaxID=36822 RepID=A0ABT4MY26_GORRU|nr:MULTISPECIES: DUF2786 domain-containing protein [Mycobacteriales]MBA4026441.1 DUF2786 domain-containing protein [Gordonia sp. (in: high G+C Gram-positive bacteria)]MCZ4551724.1 DUF2786 domain-containing protein [Gordonia rubripertincta]OZG31161.1 hypothetical protein BH683_000400 [Williamsia sp. 1138]